MPFLGGYQPLRFERGGRVHVASKVLTAGGWCHLTVCGLSVTPTGGWQISNRARNCWACKV